MTTVLPVIESARMETGKSWKQIAREMACTYRTIYDWVRGFRPVPHHKRKQFSSAIGANIDWTQYERERQENSDNDMVSPDMVPAAPPETLRKPRPPRDEFAELYGDL